MIMRFTDLRLSVRTFLVFIILISGTMSIEAQVPKYSWGNVRIGGGGYVTGIVIHPLME